jgi:hypothetical protein
VLTCEDAMEVVMYRRLLRAAPAGTKRSIAHQEETMQPVYVNQRYFVSQSQEPGVLISMREYDRLIERLDGCKPDGWADLWLAGVGGGVTLAVGALVGALTLPASLLGARDILWALTATGAVVFMLCMVAYLTQRRELGAEIGELKKDLEIYRDRAGTT